MSLIIVSFLSLDFMGHKSNLLKENPFLTGKEKGKGIVFKDLAALTYPKHITHLLLRDLEDTFKCAVMEIRYIVQTT